MRDKLDLHTRTNGPRQVTDKVGKMITGPVVEYRAVHYAHHQLTPHYMLTLYCDLHQLILVKAAEQIYDAFPN